MLGEPIRPGVDTTPVPLDLGVSPKVEHFATVRMLVTAHMMTRAICVTDNDEVGCAAPRVGEDTPAPPETELDFDVVAAVVPKCTTRLFDLCSPVPFMGGT